MKQYFDRIARMVRQKLNVNIGIYHVDHRRTVGADVLGCCHRFYENGLVVYIITIDEGYIRQCYHGVRYSPYSTEALIETICHEIAHTMIWEHGAEHSALTKALYRVVTEK